MWSNYIILVLVFLFKGMMQGSVDTLGVTQDSQADATSIGANSDGTILPLRENPILTEPGVATSDQMIGVHQERDGIAIQDAATLHSSASVQPNDQPKLIGEKTIVAEQKNSMAPEGQLPLVQDVPNNTLLEENKDDIVIGLGTVSLEDAQGNWLFKKIWWERAQEQYEKIRGFLNQIMDYRMQFFMQRSELDRLVLDPFYVQIGFAQGQMQEIIESILVQLENERTSNGVLDAAERRLNDDAEGTKEVLEKLKIDLQMINTLDHTLDDALEQLVQQINKVRAYEQEAWQSYKKIGQELSDTKARDLFYNLDINMRNIKDIQRYLQQDFARYFQDLVRQISTETQRLIAVVNGLKEKGIDFKKQIFQEHEYNDRSMSESPEQQLDDQAEMVQNSEGLINKIVQFVRNVGSGLKNFFGALYSSIKNIFGMSESAAD